MSSGGYGRLSGWYKEYGDDNHKRLEQLNSFGTQEISPELRVMRWDGYVELTRGFLLCWAFDSGYHGMMKR